MNVLFMVMLSILFVLTVFNVFILIGIARLMVKLVQYLGPDEKSDREHWAGIIRNRRFLQMQEGNPANYADQTARTKVVAPSRHWDGIPKGRNWDGIPQSEDE